MQEIMRFNIALSVQIGPSGSVCRVLGACPKKTGVCFSLHSLLFVSLSHTCSGYALTVT